MRYSGMLALLAWALILYMSVINELWLALVFPKYIISLLHLALTIGNNIVEATGTIRIQDNAPYLKQRKSLSCYFGDD